MEAKQSVKVYENASYSNVEVKSPNNHVNINYSRHDFWPGVGFKSFKGRNLEIIDSELFQEKPYDSLKTIGFLAYHIASVSTIAIATASYILIEPLRSGVNNLIMENVPLVESAVHVANEFFKGF